MLIFGISFKRLLQALVGRLSLTGRYRPELHYMRGPGPKTFGLDRPTTEADGKSVRECDPPK